MVRVCSSLYAGRRAEHSKLHASFLHKALGPKIQGLRYIEAYEYLQSFVQEAEAAGYVEALKGTTVTMFSKTTARERFQLPPR